jgi:hypothetical protein
MYGPEVYLPEAIVDFLDANVSLASVCANMFVPADAAVATHKTDCRNRGPLGVR